MDASSATPPAYWWTNLTVVLDTFSPPAWTPTWSDERNHGILSSFRSNEFDVESPDYALGIVTVGIPFLVIGIVSLLCMPFLYCCVAYFDCCCGTLKRSRPKDSGLKWLFLFASVLAVAGGTLSIAGLVAAERTIDSASSNINVVGKTLDSAADLVADVVGASAATAAAFDDFTSTAYTCSKVADKAQRFDMTLLNGTVREDVHSFIADIKERLDSVKMESTTRSLANTTFEAQETLEVTHEDQRAVTITLFCINMVVILGFVVNGWCIFFAPSDSKGPDSSCCGAWLTCLLSPAAVIIIFASWILTAGTVMLSAFTGDFCMDPNGNTMKITGDSALVQYYLFCEEEPTVPPVVVYNVRLAFASAMENLDAALSAAFEPGSCMGSSDSLPALSRALYSWWTVLEEVQVMTECRGINTFYTKVTYVGICTDLSLSLQLLVVGSFILALALMIVMVVYRIGASAARPSVSRYEAMPYAVSWEASAPVPFVPYYESIK